MLISPGIECRLVERFDVSHLEQSCHPFGVGAVTVAVLGNDHFVVFHHLVDAGSPVPINRLRVTVLDGKERVFLDVLTVFLLLAEAPEYLSLPSRCQCVPITLKGYPTIIKSRGWG